MRQNRSILALVVPICVAFWAWGDSNADQSGDVPPTAPAQTMTELPEPVVQAMHSAPITVLLASSQSGLLASGSIDGTVKIWLVKTGELLHTLVVSPSWVRSFAFSPDGRRLAVGAGDHSVYTYDAILGTPLRRFDGADSAVTAVAFSGDGRLLAAGTSRDDVVRVWAVDSGELYARIRNPPPALALAFGRAPNELWIADAKRTTRWRFGLTGQAEEVMLRDERVGAPLAFAPPSEDKLSAVDASGRTIAVAQGRNFTWSLRDDGSPKRPVALAPASVRAIRFSPDDRTLVHSTSTGGVAVWDLEFGELSHFLPNAAAVTPPFANAIAFSRDGTTVLTVQEENRKRSWKLSSPAPSAPPDPRGDFSESAVVSYLASGRDIGALPPLSPPRNLRIVGAPITLTHAAAISSTNERVVYAGFVSPPDTLFVSVEDARTGHELWNVHLPEARFATAVAVVSDGRAVAVAVEGRGIAWLDGANGHVQRWLQPATDSSIRVLAFSHDGGLLACGAENGSLQLWSAEGEALPKPIGHLAAVTALNFSIDGGMLASGGADNVINIWDVRRSASVRKLFGHASAVTALAYAHGRAILASGSEDSTTRIWNSPNGQLLATVSAGGPGNWLVISPNGFFDGTRQSWNSVPFRFPSAPTHLYRPEQFFAHFYQPGLLAEVVARQTPISDLLRDQHDKRAELNVASYAKSKPAELQIKVAKAADPVATRSVQVEISAVDRGSGLRDLRLFRNQSLVRFIHGDLRVDPATNSYHASIPVDITEGANEILAYVFNRDDIKSEDAVINIVGAPTLKRRGKAYIISVGISNYSNKEFNLSYAASDAEVIASTLKETFDRVSDYAAVEPVTLINEEATKRNVLQTLQLLAGDSPVLDSLLSRKLASLQRTTPEDVVILYFAGHGDVSGGNYYLLTHNIGYQGSRQHMTLEAWKTIYANAISDRALNDALERIDSAQMMLVIDACYAGGLLDSNESRRGPLNSRGIAQLAYEKGAYVLAAAQSNQAALELQRLGHGVLTFALIEKGLKAFGADTDGDGRITAKEWIRYASDQVPLEILALNQERSVSGRLVTVGDQPVTVQRPRLYFRRDQADDWLISTRNR